MPDREKVIAWLADEELFYREHGDAFNSFMACNALAMLKKQEAKPLRCKECSYHRDDGWCNEHRREVKESDYCSFGAWEGW